MSVGLKRSAHWHVSQLADSLKSGSHLPKKFVLFEMLKMMKNTLYFILKALFVLKIFKLLSWFFGHVEKMVNFEINDVTV